VSWTSGTLTAMNEVTPPLAMRDAFTCPSCRAYSQQLWFEMSGHPLSPNTGARSFERTDLLIAECARCRKLTLWVDNRIVYPANEPAPMPNPDLSDEIRADYLEARAIFTRSARGAAALLRLCIQKLCKGLGLSGKDLDKDIGSLVKRGLLPSVQKALDAVRVIGNNAVHPGQIDLNDTPDMAAALFRLVNVIAEQMITAPKQVDELYAALPDNARQAIERRDASGSSN
jgi:Domain of unknown function (DUF4145)